MEVSLSSLSLSLSLPKSVSPLILSRPKPLCCCTLGGPSFPKKGIILSIRLRSLSSTTTSPPLHSNPLLNNFASLSLSTTAISAGGGGGDALPGGGGGESGGGGGGGGESQTKSISLEEALKSTDVIVLYVGGMTCGGCAASVKRILESQPQVSTATVYLENETAVVWPVEGVKSVEEDWQKQLGEKLANHLSTCGFKSHLHLHGEEKKST